MLDLRLDLEALLFGDLLIVDWYDLVRVLVAAAALLLLLLFSTPARVCWGGSRWSRCRWLAGEDPAVGAGAGDLHGDRQRHGRRGRDSRDRIVVCPSAAGLWRVSSLRAAMLQSALVGLALSAVGFCWLCR